MFLRMRPWAFLLATSLLGVAVRAAAQEGQGNLFMPNNRPLQLLQPLGQTDQYQAMPGISIAFAYFNDAWPWIIGVAAGIAVLQALVGGVQIMMSGSSEKAEEGKTRLMWALAGLLMIAFAGFALRLLNNVFFV